MLPFKRLLPSVKDRSRLGALTFCIAWLIGNIALLIGFNGGKGEIPAIGMFVFACVAWWVGYRLGGSKTRLGSALGFLALAIWILNFLGALVGYFKYYSTDLFFWAAASTLLILIMMVGTSKAPETGEGS